MTYLVDHHIHVFIGYKGFVLFCNLCMNVIPLLSISMASCFHKNERQAETQGDLERVSMETN